MALGLHSPGVETPEPKALNRWVHPGFGAKSRILSKLLSGRSEGGAVPDASPRVSNDHKLDCTPTATDMVAV